MTVTSPIPSLKPVRGTEKETFSSFFKVTCFLCLGNIQRKAFVADQFEMIVALGGFQVGKFDNGAGFITRSQNLCKADMHHDRIADDGIFITAANSVFCPGRLPSGGPCR